MAASRGDLDVVGIVFVHVLQGRQAVLLGEFVVEIIKQIAQRIALRLSALHLLLDQRDQRFQFFADLHHAVFREEEEVGGLDHLRGNIQRQRLPGAAVFVDDARRNEADLAGRQEIFLIREFYVEGLCQDQDNVAVTVRVFLKSFMRIEGVAEIKAMCTGSFPFFLAKD